MLSARCLAKATRRICPSHSTLSSTSSQRVNNYRIHHTSIRRYDYFNYRENRVWLENMVKKRKDRSDHKRSTHYYEADRYRSPDEVDLEYLNYWFDPQGVNAKSLSPESRLPINYLNDFPDK